MVGKVPSPGVQEGTWQHGASMTLRLSPKCPRWHSPPARPAWLCSQSGEEGEGSVTGQEAQPNLSPVIMLNIDFCIPLPPAWQDWGCVEPTAPAAGASVVGHPASMCALHPSQL